MTRFQKLALLIGSLILVMLIALTAVFALKPTPPPLSGGDMTNTRAAEILSTAAPTVQAMQTGIPLTLTALSGS